MLKLSFPDALAPQAPMSNGKQSTEISPALDLFTSMPAAVSSSNSARSTVKMFILRFHFILMVLDYLESNFRVINACKPNSLSVFFPTLA